MEEINVPELKKFFIFQAMTDSELVEFVGYCTHQKYVDGYTIFYEKDRGETMHIIINGAVKITKQDGALIAVLREGDFFGEVALFDYALRSAGAVADGNVLLLEIHRNNFNKLFNKNPVIIAKLLYQLMTEMSRRLRAKNNPGGLIF